jgi:hypothetical protein
MKNKKNKVVAFEAHEVQARVLVDEDGRVRALGEAIGYGNMMRLAERLWRTSPGVVAGAEFAVYCCVAELIPCPGCKKVESPKDCDWCCGAGRVTQKVAEAIQRLEPAT